MSSAQFGVEIPITIVDHTAAPIAAAQQKLTALEKAALKVGTTKIAPTVTLQDKASMVIKSIETSLQTLARGAYHVTVNLAGNVLSKIEQLFSTLFQITRSEVGC